MDYNEFHSVRKLLENLIKHDTEKIRRGILNKVDIERGSEILHKIYDYCQRMDDFQLEYQDNPDNTKEIIEHLNKDMEEKIYPLREKAAKLQQQYFEIASVLGRTTPVNVSENPNLLPPNEYAESTIRFDEPTESLPMSSQIDPSIAVTRMSVSTVARPSMVRRQVVVHDDEEEKKKYINNLKTLLSKSPSVRDKIMNALVTEFIKGDIPKDVFEQLKTEFESYNIKKPFEYKLNEYAPTIKTQERKTHDISFKIPNYNSIFVTK